MSATWGFGAALRAHLHARRPRWSRLTDETHEFRARQRSVLIGIVIAHARVNLSGELLARDHVVYVAIEVETVRTHLTAPEHCILPRLVFDRLDAAIVICVGASELAGDARFD